MMKIRLANLQPALVLAACLCVSACGEKPLMSPREMNPIIYMHRHDSTTIAVRVNRVYRVSIGHAMLTRRETKDIYSADWVFIPDTVGVFKGYEIGRTASSTTSGEIIRTDAFPKERIEIGGGYIHFRRIANMEIEGKFKVAMRSSDPCARGCESEEVLLPVPP